MIHVLGVIYLSTFASLTLATSPPPYSSPPLLFGDSEIIEKRWLGQRRNLNLLPFVIVKYSHNQILSQVNLQKQFIFLFSFLTFSEKYNTFCKYLHYQTILLVEKRYINRKNQTKKPAAGAARILIFYSSPPPRNPKKRDKGEGDL